MGVGTVNHNLSAINSLRNIQSTDSSLNKSLEKLSSGLRINRAADDAAGLAVSEKMRAQIHGLEQAQANAQDAISMIQTGEGVMDTVHSTLQRIRQLGLQSSSDTYTTQDRKYIQQEIGELISEIDRVSAYTEFNTKKLMNGNATGMANTVDKTLATASVVGAVTNADYSVTVLDAGSASNVHGTVGLTAAMNTMSTVGISSGSELQISIDNRTTVVDLNASDTIQDVVNKINNSNAGVVAGIRSTNGSNYLTMTSTHSGSRFNISFGTDPDGAASKLGLYGGDKDTSSITTAPFTGDARYRFTSGTDSIISITNVTNQSLFPTSAAYGQSLGVFKSDSDIFTEVELNNPVTITNANNLNTNSPDAASASALSSSTLLKGITIYVDENVDTGFYTNNTSNAFTYSAATPNASADSRLGVAARSGTMLTVRDRRQVYQIGANEEQNITVSFGNVSAEALGLSTSLRAGGYSYNGSDKMSNGATTTDSRQFINVETKEGADHALGIVDEAIDKVNTIRSQLGAYQNSLEKSVDYLSISYENQTASESRIRDVDMAMQITTFVKDQILLQSGTAMLAQSNIKPESVLNLLR